MENFKIEAYLREQIGETIRDLMLDCQLGRSLMQGYEGTKSAKIELIDRETTLSVYTELVRLTTLFEIYQDLSPDPDTERALKKAQDNTRISKECLVDLLGLIGNDPVSIRE